MQLIYKTSLHPNEPLSIYPNGKVNLSKTNVSFDLSIGGLPGKNTCKARCEQCFLAIDLGSNGKKDSKRNINDRISKEKVILQDLKQQGYSVCPIIPDSFAWDGKYLESGILYQNTLYGADELSATGIAWTSGLTLLGDDKNRLLELAYDNNLRLIGISSHDIEDGETPLKGVVKPSVVRKVLKNIHEYNHTHPEKKLEISLGFTIGTHNLLRIWEYVAYAAAVGADYVRFNRLLDVSCNDHFSDLVLTAEETRIFFMEMHEIEQTSFDVLTKLVQMKKEFISPEMNPNINVVISNDFGFKGEALLGKSGLINRCAGGTSHFGILANTIYPCVELVKTGFKIGELVLEDRAKVEGELGVSIGADKQKVYTPVFDVEMVERMQKVLNASEYNGCLAHSHLMYVDKV
ncbi:MAG: hypothetical protein HXX16_07425 [Bacteroidales bacterium]|nr:hypothetical protein [Bacteroidales bacterium]